jgi:prepilin-type N-terminal cleavage/methylation domain-containing protein
MFKKRKEGFTLVELLIVLAVIAALLAIITPVAVNAVKKAKATQVASTLRNIAAAVQQFYYTEQMWPENGLETLEASGYIQGNIKDYELRPSNADTDTTTEGSVVYKGGTVDFSDVQKLWNEVKQSGNIIYVDIEVSKYW